MLFGMEDGSIRIQNLEKEYSLDELGSHWQLNLHDNNYGSIVKVAASPDEKMLLSAGYDGNFFLYDIMDQEKVDQKVAEAKAKIPSAKVSLSQLIYFDVINYWYLFFLCFSKLNTQKAYMYLCNMFL